MNRKWILAGDAFLGVMQLTFLIVYIFERDWAWICLFSITSAITICMVVLDIKNIIDDKRDKNLPL